MNAGLFGEFNGLFDGIEDGIGLIAQMGEITRAVALEHPAESHELLVPGIRAGRGEQTRRHPERPGGERLL